MTKRKKIILFSLALTLTIAARGYSLWSQNVENQKVIKWVKEQDGMVELSSPKWAEKLPGFIKVIVGINITMIDLTYIDNSGLSPRTSDLSYLKNMTHLRELNISDTAVTDISVIKNMTSLQTLNLSGTKVTDFSALKNLTNMKFLFIHNTQVTDLLVIKNMTKMEYLSLDGTEVTDLSVIENMTKIEFLDLYDTQVTDDQIKELKLKMPKLKIHKEK